MQNNPGSKRPDNVPILIWIGVSLGVGALYVGKHNQYIGLIVAMAAIVFLFAGIIRWAIAGSNMTQLRQIEAQNAEIIQLLKAMQVSEGQKDQTVEPSSSQSASPQVPAAGGDSDAEDDPR